MQFILDADTVLESNDYIERSVHDLCQAAGIASACGTVLPLRQRDRRAADESPRSSRSPKHFLRINQPRRKAGCADLASAATNTYREVLYLFLQRIVYRGQMAVFGTLSNPVGCAVAYRREYLKALFDEVEPTLGDDLTNSEDIFIGLAMVNEGYRNIHVPDVCARTVEPEVQRCRSRSTCGRRHFCSQPSISTRFLRARSKRSNGEGADARAKERTAAGPRRSPRPSLWDRSPSPE